MESKNYAAGETIFTMGDDAKHLFFVLSGELEVRQDDFMAVIKRGEIFGESALLSRPRTLAARAKSDCVLLSITRDEIIESFAKDPDLVIQIVDALSTKLAKTTDELIRLKGN
jgi:CRP-like cAMP-binding protein